MLTAGPSGVTTVPARWPRRHKCRWIADVPSRAVCATCSAQRVLRAFETVHHGRIVRTSTIAARRIHR